MAKGPRAPSQSAYQGSIGRTHTERVHVTTPTGQLVGVTVHTTIDAVSDPELVEQLHAGALNVVTFEGGSVTVSAPVVYHDPAAEVMALVLGEVHRHSELDERIRLYERLRADPAAIPVYVRDFAVVFGPAGLRTYLEARAEQAVGENASERLRRELETKTRELEARQQAVETRARQLDARAQDLDVRSKDIERQRRELERVRAETRAHVLASVGSTKAVTRVDLSESAPPDERDDVHTKPVSRQSLDQPDELVTASTPPRPESAQADNGVVARRSDAADTGGSPIVPPGSDPLTTETTELPLVSDPWLDLAAAAQASSVVVEDGHVRLALVASEQIARGLGGALDVRVLLHRVPTYPVIVLVIGPPAALRVPSPSQLAVIALDACRELDRQALRTLARKFELTVELVVRGAAVRRVRMTAPLVENVAYILRAADDHLHGLDTAGDSFARACELVLAADFDLLSVDHAEHAEFRDDKLAQLGTTQAVRRALALTRRFARPTREDYLVCARGFPIMRWRELRRHVLESAIAWGLWMGPELAQLSVSEGLARSRRDLVAKLEAGFETVRRDPDAFDLDDDAADDNSKAIAEEARALGVPLRRKPTNGGAIKSEDLPEVSGSIENTPTSTAPRVRTLEELISLLDDKSERVSAAAELCDRGDARAAAAVIAATRKMSRAEAVRILGKSVKLGPAATEPLLEGLRSSKAFLRHGCALALALLHTEHGTLAVIDLLLEEPTEIWREVARAIGQIGPSALMALASRAGQPGDGLAPVLADRIAWAMAHIGVRGGKAAIEQMASGQTAVAPIATQALRLLDNAARDEIRVTPGQAPKEVTVNRAFSRRFFEALDADRRVAPLHDLDASRPFELEDGDLITLEAEDEEAELDESDLIQT
jgi:PAS domain-containing protein